MYDSSGILSVLDRFRRPGQARWVPLVDTNLLARKEGKVESYWPVGVGGGKFGCVILKVSLLEMGGQNIANNMQGSEKEPGFPRPIVQELDVSMPLLNMSNQQGKLEER
jgi:chromosome transmission fidelity protein 4